MRSRPSLGFLAATLGAALTLACAPAPSASHNESTAPLETAAEVAGPPAVPVLVVTALEPGFPATARVDRLPDGAAILARGLFLGTPSATCNPVSIPGYPGTTPPCVYLDNALNLTSNTIVSISRYRSLGTWYRRISFALTVPPGFDCEERSLQAVVAYKSGRFTQKGRSNIVDRVIGDGDLDGACANDCDDANSTIYVGAPELCDDLDNDCDSTVDEHEGEVCDSVDNDCDGQIDEDDAAGCTLGWLDSDQDGYGLPGSEACACAPSPLQNALVGGDCADEDADIYPGAPEALAPDGVDANCDGYDLGPRGTVAFNDAGELVCVISPDTGLPSCWGSNFTHQGTPPVEPMLKIALSGTNSAGGLGCGLRPDGSVVCWGYGTLDPDMPNDGAQNVPPAGTFVDLTVAGGTNNFVSCAVSVGGSIQCWGALDADHPQFVNPPPGRRFTTIDGEGSILCATLDDGGVDCWGDPSNGLTLSEPTGLRDVSTNGIFACGTTPANGMSCWAQDPTLAFQEAFLDEAVVAGGGVAVDLHGLDSGCVLRADGTTRCWSYVESDRYTVDVPFIAMANGGLQNYGGLTTDLRGGTLCGIRRDEPTFGEFFVACVGESDYAAHLGPSLGTSSIYLGAGSEMNPWGCRSQIGGDYTCWTGSVNTNQTPAGLENLSAASSVSRFEGDRFETTAPHQSICALATVGGAAELLCNDWLTPIVANLPVEDVSVYDKSVCTLLEDGSILCWGVDDAGEIANAPTTGVYTDVELHQENACAVRIDGEIVCWGADDGSILSPPAGPFRTTDALAVVGDSGGSGSSGACAVRTSGTVACWSLVGFTAPPAGSGFRQVVGGNFHACARDVFGEVTCWAPSSQTEILATPEGTFYDVWASSRSTCAARLDRPEVCWGRHVRTWNDPR